KQARARRKDLIERQPGMLQCHGPEKRNIEVRATSAGNATGDIIQGFDGVECLELPPRVQIELLPLLDPPCHDGLMIAIMYDERGALGKPGGELGLESVPGRCGLC